MEFFLPNLSSLQDSTVVYLHDGSNHSRSLLGIGIRDHFQSHGSHREDLTRLQHFLNRSSGWILGWLSYDVKNSIEDLQSHQRDEIGFPDICFFRPRILLSIEREELEVIEGDDQADLTQVLQAIRSEFLSGPLHDGKLMPRLSREEYIADIQRVKEHIQRGDIYELNYCQEFSSHHQPINPFNTYRKLHGLTKAPFSVFLRHGDSYLLCGSPERYIQRKGQRLISQPIKGTIRRGSTPREDEMLKEQLRTDEKERGENIMITDLVRNDLSKSALPGSVHVDELCGIYTFETVHQMISTVSSEISSNTTFTQVLEGTFPMGSMTGAPKVRAMQLIDEIERSGRGLYSGSVGYINPDGEFDFNVVIRSLLYNAQTNYLAARVGGAITALSDPEKEYEECLLKAEALFRSLR